MAPVYRETVPLPAWAVLALLASLFVCAGALTGLRDAVAASAPGERWAWDLSWGVGCLVLVVVPLCFGRMVIEVDDRAIRVRFGFVPLVRREIPLSLLTGARWVEYRPILQFGGWGIRRGRFEGAATAVYSLRGRAGVLLTLRRPIETLLFRTDRILIGSERPHELAARLAAVGAG